MKATDLVGRANPVGNRQVDAWVRDRQELVWSRVVAGIAEDSPAARAPRPTRARRPLALAAAVVVIVVAGLLVGPLRGHEGGGFNSTAQAAEALPPVELSADAGYIWRSPEVSSAVEAARRFNDEAIGWPAPEVVAQTTAVGPTWLEIRHGGEKVVLLFAPEGEDAGRWRLLQIGTDPDMARVSIDSERTEVTLGTIPPGTASLLVLTSGDPEPTKTKVTDVSGTDHVTVEGAARSVVTLYFDEAGALIDARGSHA